MLWTRFLSSVSLVAQHIRAALDTGGSRLAFRNNRSCRTMPLHPFPPFLTSPLRYRFFLEQKNLAPCDK